MIRTRTLLTALALSLAAPAALAVTQTFTSPGRVVTETWEPVIARGLLPGEAPPADPRAIGTVAFQGPSTPFVPGNSSWEGTWDLPRFDPALGELLQASLVLHGVRTTPGGYSVRLQNPGSVARSVTLVETRRLAVVAGETPFALYESRVATDLALTAYPPGAPFWLPGSGGYEVDSPASGVFDFFRGAFVLTEGLPQFSAFSGAGVLPVSVALAHATSLRNGEGVLLEVGDQLSLTPTVVYAYAAPIPEPSTWALFFAGLIGLCVAINPGRRLAETLRD